MKIIGLTGFAKSGKSTAAQILKEMGGVEIAFAKHLKDVCSVVLGVERDAFDNQNKKEIPFYYNSVNPDNCHPSLKDIKVPNPIKLTSNAVEMILHYFEVEARYYPEAILKHTGMKLNSPRHVAQYVGTEILRSIDENIHINMAFKLNEKVNAKFLVCSDVRFHNELVAVSQRGGSVIGISRKSATPSNLETLHPSEKEIPALIKSAHYLAENEGTIEEFKRKIEFFVS